MQWPGNAGDPRGLGKVGDARRAGECCSVDGRGEHLEQDGWSGLRENISVGVDDIDLSADGAQCVGMTSRRRQRGEKDFLLLARLPMASTRLSATYDSGTKVTLKPALRAAARWIRRLRLPAAGHIKRNLQRVGAIFEGAHRIRTGEQQPIVGRKVLKCSVERA